MQSSKLLRQPADKVQNFNRGFTLLELIIVFAIISIMATLGIAAFVEYNRSQTLNTAALDLVNVLALAKSRAQSQVKPDACTGTLEGYKVGLCSFSSSDCSANDSDKDYVLYAVCSNAPFIIRISSKKFSTTSIEFDSSTTTGSVMFPVLTGGAIGSGSTDSIVLSGFDKTKTITVDSSGNISSD